MNLLHTYDGVNLWDVALDRIHYTTPIPTQLSTSVTKVNVKLATGVTTLKAVSHITC